MNRRSKLAKWIVLKLFKPEADRTEHLRQIKLSLRLLRIIAALVVAVGLMMAYRIVG